MCTRAHVRAAASVHRARVKSVNAERERERERVCERERERELALRACNRVHNFFLLLFLPPFLPVAPSGTRPARIKRGARAHAWRASSRRRQLPRHTPSVPSLLLPRTFAWPSWSFLAPVDHVDKSAENDLDTLTRFSVSRVEIGSFDLAKLFICSTPRLKIVRQNRFIWKVEKRSEITLENTRTLCNFCWNCFQRTRLELVFLNQCNAVLIGVTRSWTHGGILHKHDDWERVSHAKCAIWTEKACIETSTIFLGIVRCKSSTIE